MVHIDRNVPVPQRLKTSEYPFEAMSPGDSFGVSYPEDALGDEISRLRARVSAAAARASRSLNKRFTLRTQRKENEIRVWCVQ